MNILQQYGMEEKKMYRTSDLAKATGYTTAGIRLWVKTGKVKGKKVGGLIWFEQEVVVQILERLSQEKIRR